jgi:glycine amidinotransferase
MEGESSKTVVNSWNEWDPLKHIIVGVPDGCCIPPPEPASTPEIPMDSAMKGEPGPRSTEAVEKARNQMDNFAKILQARGIRVDRPTPLDFSREVETPDWNHGSMVGCMPARDVLLTVGSEILEATMSNRSRWFEYLAYRPLLQSYFEEDPHMRWEAAPKPRLTDASFRPGYLRDSITREERRDMVARKDFVTTEFEPLFDAADVARFGKDLFVQHGFTTNLKGMEWLRRHFPNHRIHALNFPGDPYPIHIDATFSPLRPGLILNNPVRRLPDEQRRIFEKNGWEILETAQPAHKTPPPLCYSSIWLSMNSLILDPKTVCVEASEVHQMDQLDGLGFEVVPIPFRDAYAFGGGLHCATADVHRDGTCEDYFPKQI